jgi:hypothetical protein
MPAATKPDGKTVKGGRFNVNGTITISAKVIPVEDKDLQTKRYNTRASQTDYSIPDVQTTNTSEYTNEESLRNYNSNQSNPV